MLFHLNLEELDGRWVAHVPDRLGCFVAAADQVAVLAEAPQAISDYYAWLQVWRNKMGGVIDEGFLPTGPAELDPTTVQVTLAEVQAAQWTEDETEVNAFFASDAWPLTAQEVNVARQLLWWSREDLLNSLLGLSSQALATVPAGETWSVREVVRHVGTGENWFLDRLGLASAAAWDMADELGRLILVRQHLLEALPSWIDEPGTLTHDYEQWSPRKVVRRALWHEHEHIQQILQLRQQLSRNL